MIIDTSALIAVVRTEPDAAALALAIATAAQARISAANHLEASIVVDRTGDPVASRQLDELLSEGAVVIEPFTADQAALARQAYRDFGTGSGHPAGLNFGDCFAYALAKDLGEPLLYKGDDFVHTDVQGALG